MPRRQVTLTEVLDTGAFSLKASIYKIQPGIVVNFHATKPPTVDVQPGVHDVRLNDDGSRLSEPCS